MNIAPDVSYEATGKAERPLPAYFGVDRGHNNYSAYDGGGGGGGSNGGNGYLDYLGKR